MMYVVESISASHRLGDRQTNDHQKRQHHRDRSRRIPFHPQAVSMESCPEAKCSLHSGVLTTPISTELWMRLRQPRI